MDNKVYGFCDAGCRYPVPTVEQMKEYINGIVFNESVLGSYVGTGTYGANTPTVLTFDFEPKAVFVTSELGQGFMINGESNTTISGNTSDVFVTWNGNTVSWYNAKSAASQNNASGYNYFYVAIG